MLQKRDSVAFSPKLPEFTPPATYHHDAHENGTPESRKGYRRAGKGVKERPRTGGLTLVS